MYAICRLATSPPTSRFYVLRRLVALTLCFAFACFSLEAVIADVCDGDAAPAEVARVATDRWLHAPAADAAARGELVQVSSSEIGSDESTAPGTTPTADHGAHVCHCGHTHAPVAGEQTALLVSSPPRVPAAFETRNSVASADPASALRPPIA